MLTRDSCNISAALENMWIERIHDLEKVGMTYGNNEYDTACANLCAIADEFWIWDDD